MSDIPVVEISTPPTSTKEAAEPKAIKAAKPVTGWVRTRFCNCPPTAGTDCRFHSPSEPGWETCPWEKKSGKADGRWLWARGVQDLKSDEQLSIGAEIKELTRSQQRAADKYLH